MLENVQIGLDLASALSIIGAAIIFMGQLTKDRSSRRSNEMWIYFKQVTDDISKYKMKYVSSLLQFQHTAVEEITQAEVNRIIDDIAVSTDEFAFHIKYYTKTNLENLLLYYQGKEPLKKEILELIDILLDKIAIYQGDIPHVRTLCNQDLTIEVAEAVRQVLVQFTIAEVYTPLPYPIINADGDRETTETNSKQNIVMILDEFNLNYLNKIKKI